MNKKGWTLVELMIIVSMFSILSLSISSLFLHIWRFYRITYVQKELQEEARTVMEHIMRNLRNARSDTIVISRHNSQQPPYSKIDFYTVTGSSVSYYQINRTLYWRVGNSTPNILSKSVTYFAVTFPKSYEMNIVSVALTLERYLYDIRRKALHVASEKIMVMN
ncbi:MAG: hypothetical protein N2643_05390 [Endomicrobia bacterium]|nr:hypothetical protein [Endomicrobiia bacterium]